MENNVEKALNDFVGISETVEELEEKTKVNNAKKVILDEREGLIERVDKVFVTKDGKQLLREVY
jgi:hypothetical protein